MSFYEELALDGDMSKYQSQIIKLTARIWVWLLC